MGLELIIRNETLYPIKLEGVVNYLGSGQSVKVDTETWDKLKDNPEIEKLLLCGEISVTSGHLSTLDGLDFKELESAIKGCKDVQTLRKWFLASKKDRSDLGKFARYNIYQQISTLGHFKWLQGDQDGLYDEHDWHPRMLGKTDNLAAHQKAQNAVWERQFKLAEIDRKTKEFKQNLLKAEGLV